MTKLVLILAIASLAFAGSIDRNLELILNVTPDTETIPVFILVEGQIDGDWVDGASSGMTRAERQEFAVQAMKELAEVAQQGVIHQLESLNAVDIRSLWLANAVYCQASPSAIREISTRADVVLIEQASHPGSGLVEPVEVNEVPRSELDKAITWSVTQINADDVWAMGYEGEGVIVGVIDTGVDYNHSDLGNNMWHDTPAGYHYGWDFYDGDSDPMDDYGHGTHCAGSVAGDGTAGTETGVAPSATLMALRINYYYGGEPTWIEAMEFGTDNGAAVLTMSLGSGQGNTTLRTAEENLLTAGVFHSVCAHNDGPGAGTIRSSGDSPPPWFHPDQIYHGGLSAVITVGATDNSDVIANFSSRGPVTCWTDYTDSSPLIDPDICGPGVDVISTQWTGGYTSMSGTSMATPHVAGVAALMLSANPDLTVAQMDSLIEVTSLDLGTAGKDNTYGAGRVDAYQAVLGALELVGIEDETYGAVQPSVLGISAVSPNPVSYQALFTVNSVTAGVADIALYDVSGRRAANIATGELVPGANAFNWQVPEQMSSGVYFIRVSMNNQVVSSRMTLVR